MPHLKYLKPLFVAIVFLLLSNLNAQEKKYQSLLWEVSGNNTEKPSYLYGTMHVSERIAFHLSDVFFDAILNTDKIALESNPEFWMDEMEKSPEQFYIPDYEGSKGFYKSFNRKPVEDYQIAGLLKFNDYMTNGILYRTNESNEDYQEQTYLDMFIFQVGKRTHRDVVALEGFKESRDLVEKASSSNIGFTPKPWTKKLLKDKSYFLVLQNAYRDKDLDLLDSLNRGFNSDDYIKYMLTKRNQNMVHRMDSILQKKQTIFAGVGAAHLPGSYGMIELLRDKGYTVKPVLGEYSEKGKDTKESLDKNYIYEVYSKHKVSDNIIELPTPKKIYEFSFFGNSISISPDIKNGAFLSISRSNTYDYLRDFDYQSTTERVDSLFFENIPGKILEKKKVTINGFEVWDIKNETKSLDRQHFMVAVTPLEIIVVNLSGKNNFVAKKEEEVFSNVYLKPMSSNWKTIEPLQGGFSVNLPSYHTISNNGEFSNLLSSPEISAYDPTDKSYYFLIQNTVNDIKLLEDTEFEHRRIHQQFYKSLDKDSINTKYNAKQIPEFYSETKLGKDKTLKLKSIINGSHYYLLGSTSKTNATKFFDSFDLKPFNYYKEKEEYNDSVLYYKNQVGIKPVKSHLDYQFQNRVPSNENTNHFKEEFKIRNFRSESKKEIEVKKYQFHRYEYFENIDSLWDDIVKRNEEINSFKIKSKKTYKNDRNEFVFDAIYEDTASIQNMKARYILKNGVMYSMKTLVDDNYKNDDQFIEEFYTNFTPKDTIIGQSLFERKSKLFFEDIKSSEDSIRNSAKLSLHKIKFKKDDINPLIETIKTYDFQEDELQFKADLIEALGDIEDAKVQEFLIDYYQESEDNSIQQIAILAALANQKNEKVYPKIIELMEQDLPLPYSYRANLFQIFYPMKENHKQSKVVFPDILQFFSVPEYKNQILDLTESLIDSAAINPKQIESFSKQIVTNGKLEIKRVKARILSDKQEKYTYNSKVNLDNLITYDRLISRLPSNENIKSFHEKMDKIQDPSLDIYRIEKAIKNKSTKPNKSIENLIKDDEWHDNLYETLYDKKKLDWLPKNLTEEKVALSQLKKEIRFDKEKEDSLDRIHFEKISYKNKQYKVWVYKFWHKNEYAEQEEIHPKIAFIAYELDEKGNINPEKFNSENHISFIDDESLKDTYKSIKDKVLFKDKARVQFDDSYGYEGAYGY